MAAHHPIVMNARHARGTHKGLPILYLLMASSELGIIALLIVYFIFVLTMR